MADEQHKTVLLSILATTVAGFLILVATVVVGGGFSIDLVRGYVLPLFISAFTLGIFWLILVARNKGKLPWLEPANTTGPEPQKKQETN